MPVIRFNNVSNRNASDIARRAQGRAVYANSLVNQKTLEQNCLNRVVMGPAATTSYDGMKYTDQRVGAVFTTPSEAAQILISSPCDPADKPFVPPVYPTYQLSCDDTLGIQIMASGTFTKFTFTTTSLGAGVIDFQFFSSDTFVSDQLVVLGVDSNLITPPQGIDEVRYVFRCTPYLIELSCIAVSKVLQWTTPYSFQYITDLSGATTVLTLYKHPIGGGETVSHTITNGQTYTPSPAWGYDAWDMTVCPVGSLVFPGTSANVVSTDGDTSLQLGAGDFTVEWYQYYDDDTASGQPRIFAYDTVVQVVILNAQNKVRYYEEAGSTVTLDIPAPYRNTWVHFAACRSAGIVYLYQGGSLIGEVASTTNLASNTTPLTIGNVQVPSTETGFKGKITNFRLIPGVALYPDGTPFTPPTTPFVPFTGTQLLLDVLSPYTYLTDSSPAQRTVTATDVEWSSEHP